MPYESMSVTAGLDGKRQLACFRAGAAHRHSKIFEVNGEKHRHASEFVKNRMRIIIISALLDQSGRAFFYQQ
ncbi:hypothetical protein [Herbaspirillum sp. CAH-3]|uniref:hypothetical protein n=1 Tax=Herbaspirillum sp. CAH-3 TaxID=2605746 RepID=UPI0012AC7F94|nr:hypothetical protein [Herbaspirillum sp. CAH-3]MRT29629.1 hypothetical protein [Herbaspirillum sp. CAH-3]